MHQARTDGDGMFGQRVRITVSLLRVLLVRS